MPRAHHIALYRILYYTIFALLFLYFYIAFMSRDITIDIFFAYTRSELSQYVYKVRLFNIQFFYSLDLFQIQRTIFSRIKCNLYIYFIIF